MSLGECGELVTMLVWVISFVPYLHKFINLYCSRMFPHIRLVVVFVLLLCYAAYVSFARSSYQARSSTFAESLSDEMSQILSVSATNDRLIPTRIVWTFLLLFLFAAGGFTRTSMLQYTSRSIFFGLLHTCEVLKSFCRCSSQLACSSADCMWFQRICECPSFVKSFGRISRCWTCRYTIWGHWLVRNWNPKNLRTMSRLLRYSIYYIPFNGTVFKSLMNLSTVTERNSFPRDLLRSPKMWIHTDSNGASAGNNWSTGTLCLNLIRFCAQWGHLRTILWQSTDRAG